MRRHVARTAEIGPFVILSELGRLWGEEDRGGDVGRGIRVPPGPLARSAAGGAERVRKEKPKAAATTVDVEADVKAVDGVNVIAQRVEGLDADALLDLSDRFKQRNAPAAVVLGSVEDGRVVVNFDEAVAERVSAADVAKAAAAVVGGGGGRPTMARAGGTDPGFPTRSRERLGALTS